MWFKMHPWIFPAILGGIGLFYLVFNIGAILTSRKLQKEGSDHHVSGIPFLGGIHILIAGLELLVAHRAEHLAADVAGLDVVPAQFLGDFDLGGEIR